MKKYKHTQLTWLRVPYDARALVFRNRKLEQVLMPGRHWVAGFFQDTEIHLLDRKEILVQVQDVRQVMASGLLKEETRELEIAENERALVRVDGRLFTVLGPGLHMLWTGPHRLEAEMLNADELLKDGEVLRSLMAMAYVNNWLERWEVPEGSKGVFYRNGRLISVEGSGAYAAWKGRGSVRMVSVDCRETVLEISGQDILTADRVSLRVNVSLLIRVKDVLKTVSSSVDERDTLYREAQLAVRSEIGGRTLDELLTEKEHLGEVLLDRLRSTATGLGLEIRQAGLRDIILPGDMKDILNQVIMAGKQAEANGILRREETAAMRSQMNTAKLIRDNPTLMRLRELEVLEKISANGKLNVILGEKGLADRVTNLI